ncbi:MAG: MarR family transcriptional regulator [Bacilli bacterium]|nr:MarR family transcriptional regulator [Bacilli bacterium]
MSSNSSHQNWANEIEYLLRDINKVLRRAGRSSLGAFSITPPQFDALLLLRDHIELTIGDLSTKMYLAYSTTTDLVDRMERNQLVMRVRDLNDRRIVRLHMLERGHHIIQEATYARQTYLATVLQDVDEDMLQQWKEMLTVLHTRIV